MGEEKNKSFEQALEELEEKVHKLDDINLPVEDALQYFEQGVELVRECQHLLDNAERQIIQFSKNQPTKQNRVQQSKEGEHV